MSLNKPLLEQKLGCHETTLSIFNLFKISILCQFFKIQFIVNLLLGANNFYLRGYVKKLMWFVPLFDKLVCLQIYDASILFKFCEQGWVSFHSSHCLSTQL
jgi:hypothetical protein